VGATTVQANWSAIGITAGSYIRLQEGGVDVARGNSDPTQCNVAGPCRGEIVRVLSVSGTTATIDTSVQTIPGVHLDFHHDSPASLGCASPYTACPDANAATVAAVTRVVSGVTIRGINLDGAGIGTTTRGLFVGSVVNSNFQNIVSKSFSGSAVEEAYGYNNSYTSITISHSGGSGGGNQASFRMNYHGHLQVNGVTVTQPNASGFGPQFGSGADGLYQNISSDGTGICNGCARPFKVHAETYSVFENITVTNPPLGDNGITIEYYNMHDTFNHPVVRGAQSTGAIVLFGNNDQYNTFNDVDLQNPLNASEFNFGQGVNPSTDWHNTIHGGTVMGHNDSQNGAIFSDADYLTVDGVHFVKNPAGTAHVGLWMNGAHGLFCNNTFDPGSFQAGYDIYAPAATNGGNGNTTPDGTTPALPSATCPTQAPSPPVPPSGLVATVH
jgi:hypothetical protein